MDLYCYDKIFSKMSVATKGLTPDCRHCDDQVRRRAEFIGALERASTPFDQTNTAVEEEELEVVAENGQEGRAGEPGAPSNTIVSAAGTCNMYFKFENKIITNLLHVDLRDLLVQLYTY